MLLVLTVTTEPH